MIQAWLTASGLLLDFAGFCLLLREWWLAFFFEGSQMNRALQRAQEQSHQTFVYEHADEDRRRQMRVFEEQKERMRRQNDRNLHVSTREMRMRVFLIAAVMIVLGFALQIAGAWPMG